MMTTTLPILDYGAFFLRTIITMALFYGAIGFYLWLREVLRKEALAARIAELREQRNAPPPSIHHERTGSRPVALILGVIKFAALMLFVGAASFLMLVAAVALHEWGRDDG